MIECDTYIIFNMVAFVILCVDLMQSFNRIRCNYHAISDIPHSLPFLYSGISIDLRFMHYITQGLQYCVLKHVNMIHFKNICANHIWYHHQVFGFDLRYNQRNQAA